LQIFVAREKGVFQITVPPVPPGHTKAVPQMIEIPGKGLGFGDMKANPKGSLFRGT
jgi:hypothetical protein